MGDTYFLDATHPRRGCVGRQSFCSFCVPFAARKVRNTDYYTSAILIQSHSTSKKGKSTPGQEGPKTPKGATKVRLRACSRFLVLKAIVISLAFPLRHPRPRPGPRLEPPISRQRRPQKGLAQILLPATLGRSSNRSFPPFGSVRKAREPSTVLRRSPPMLP